MASERLKRPQEGQAEAPQPVQKRASGAAGLPH
jgi:hypothetical protein